MSAFPGIGMLRYLGITLGLNDQMSAGLVVANRNVNAFKTALGGAAGSVSLLRGQLAMLAMGSAMVFGAAAKQAAMFEREVTLAAFATDEGAKAFDTIASSSRRLSRELRQSPVEMARLNKEIAQMGELSRSTSDGLASAAVRLAMVTNGELTSEQAAKIIFRLGLVTKQTGESMDSQIGSAKRYASAIKVAGDESAAGAGAVTLMLGTLNALGQVANVTEAQLITLASVMSNVHETSREKFTTSLMRIFGKEFLDEDVGGAVADFMGMGVDTFMARRRAAPYELILDFITKIGDAARAQDKDKLEILHALGFDNIRDDQTISALSANMDTIGKTYENVSAQLSSVSNDNLELMVTTNTLLGQAQGAWEGFTSAIQRAGETIGRVVQVGLMPLLTVLAPIVELLASPIIAPLALGGGAFMAGSMGLRLYSGLRRGMGGVGFGQRAQFARGAGIFAGSKMPSFVQAFLGGKRPNVKLGKGVSTARRKFQDGDISGAIKHLEKSSGDAELIDSLKFFQKQGGFNNESAYSMLLKNKGQRAKMFEDFVGLDPDDPDAMLAPTLMESMLMMAALSGAPLRGIANIFRPSAWKSGFGKVTGLFGAGGFFANKRKNMGLRRAALSGQFGFDKLGGMSQAGAMFTAGSGKRGLGFMSRLLPFANAGGAGGMMARFGMAASPLGVLAAPMLIGQLLQGPLKMLGESLKKIGDEKGGFLGGVIKGFASFVKFLEVIANLLAFIPRIVGRAFAGMFKWAAKLPGMEWLGGVANAMTSGSYDSLDAINKFLYEKGTGKEYRPSDTAGFDKVEQNVTNINVAAYNSDYTADWLRSAARGSAFGVTTNTAPAAVGSF